MPEVGSEDVIGIGNGRYAHFRRDHAANQVQVMFTAPEGVDPNPGHELTGQFEEQGWTRWEDEPGKPWIFQLEEPSKYDPAAREDSRYVLHEQFLIIINEYRQNHGLPPTIGWQTLIERDTKASAPPSLSDNSAADQATNVREEQKPKSEKKETRAGGQGMLDAFASVGAECFDLTFTDIAGEMVRFRSNRSLGELRTAMPAILQTAAERQHNVIVRPRSSRATLIQLDDLGEEAAARLQPVSFLVLQTSPGNYQAWVAVADADEGFAPRLRKGAGADPTASGATRVSGSLNFKEKHAAHFPRVETVHASPGRIVTRDELEALGMVAPQITTPVAVHRSCSRPEARRWPSYQQCLEHPNAQKDGRPDRSLADFTWCKIAMTCWDWSVQETAEQLMRESEKAQENGEKYALRTARAAARAVDGRGGRGR